MALKMVKGSIDRMFDKNLQDLVRGIRNHKEDEVSEGPPAAPRGGTASSPTPPPPVPRLPAGSAPLRGEGGRRRPPARSPQLAASSPLPAARAP